ncbi:MAG: hypothetical protein HOC74_24810 [Gemmatimonadetes bacterium]|jgi:uncharacterized coiled-coil DUF342 family protein|nr:hypothetical protein [Gemmatimonadota bacterium]
MTEETDPQPSRPTTSADLPWGINYLREDIQDLRHQISGLREEVRAEIKDVRTEIGGLRRETGEAINGLRTEIGELRKDTGEAINGLRTEIGELRKDTGEAINGLRGEIIEQARRFETRFTWTITTIVAMTGIIIATIKL